MKATVSPTGEIKIPAAIRRKLGITPTTLLDLRVVDGAIVATKSKPKDGFEALRGVLKLDKSTDEIMAELRGRK